MGFFNWIRGNLSNTSSDRNQMVRFGRAWEVGWRPENYSGESFSDWIKLHINDDPSAADSYFHKYRNGLYDSEWYEGLSFNLPMGSTSNGSNGIGFGDIMTGLNLGLNAYNYYNQAQAYENQMKMAIQNNALAYQMFKEGNLFNSLEAQRAFERSYDASTYSNQINEMRKAGLNPAMMFGEGNTVQPPQQQAASSLGTPSLTSLAGIQPPQFNLGALTDVAAAIKNLAEAKKLGVDTDFALDTYDYRLKNEEAKSRLALVTAMIQEKYGDKMSDAELKRLAKAIEETSAKIELLRSQKDLTDEQLKTQAEYTKQEVIKALRSSKMYTAADAFGDDYWSNYAYYELQNIVEDAKQKEAARKFTETQNQYYPRVVQSMETSALGSYLSGKASVSQAETARKLYEHPRDLLGWLTRELQDNPKSIPDLIADIAIGMGESAWNRFKEEVFGSSVSSELKDLVKKLDSLSPEERKVARKLFGR